VAECTRKGRGTRCVTLGGAHAKGVGGTLNVPPENTRSQRIEGERLRECAQRIEVRQDIWIYDWHPRVHLVLAK
jgi:hypothetical protein